MTDDEAEKPQEATTLRKLSAKAASKVAQATTLIGDLNGDGRVDEEDAKIARDHALTVLTDTADEARKLTRSVARSPLAKDIATYAAVGAAIALPLPIVGPALGAAVGAGLGLWRNMKRIEPLPAPDDPIAELERLHGLKEKGILTEEEFLALKRRLLR